MFVQQDKSPIRFKVDCCVSEISYKYIIDIFADIVFTVTVNEDDNKDFKKAIGKTKTQLVHHAFPLHSFAVTSRLRHKND